MRQLQMGPMMGQQPQGFNAKAAFAGEAEAQKILDWAPTPLLLGERTLLNIAAEKRLQPLSAAAPHPQGGVPADVGEANSNPNPPLVKKTN